MRIWTEHQDVFFFLQVFQYDLRCVRIPAGGAPEGQAASHAGMKRLHFVWDFKFSQLWCSRFKRFEWWYYVIGWVGPCVPKDCMAVIFKGRQFVKCSQHRRCKALCVCVRVCVCVCVIASIAYTHRCVLIPSPLCQYIASYTLYWPFLVDCLLWKVKVTRSFWILGTKDWQTQGHIPADLNPS